MRMAQAIWKIIDANRIFSRFETIFFRAQNGLFQPETEVLRPRRQGLRAVYHVKFGRLLQQSGKGCLGQATRKMSFRSKS